MEAYKPKPLDTSGVKLTSGQTALIESLSANAHEVWAAKRIEDGWVWGDKRDDSAKTHPCLVPYAQLPESEKGYDRVMVEQVIRAAVALGYRIEKSGEMAT